MGKHISQKSLAEQIADLDDPKPKDFDPEALDGIANGGDSDPDDGSEIDTNLGREHYEAVGKSKLRKLEKPTLGPQYGGSRVSRDALAAEESDGEDPFGSSERSEKASEASEPVDAHMLDGEIVVDEDEDVEIDSDEAFGDSDIDRFKTFKFSGSRHTGATNEGSEEDDEMLSALEDQDLEETPAGDSQDSAADLASEDDMTSGIEEHGSKSNDLDPDESASDVMSSSSTVPPTDDDRAAIRKLVSGSLEKDVASRISSSLKDEAQKGQAVIKQRATFDVLLNTRIQVQKALTAANALAAAMPDEENGNVDSGAKDVVKAAEEAAVQLWLNIENLRYALSLEQHPKDSSRKRRRGEAPTSNPVLSSSELWSQMEDQEGSLFPRRRRVLEKWSSKVYESATAARVSSGSRLLGELAKTQSIGSVIEAHVTRERVKDHNEESYDDSIFYQSLLRELVDQRTASSKSTSGAIVVLPSTTKLHPKASGGKKAVDTRASKGRKVRYTPHEKLQNFTAEEDRSKWEERSRREFFGSLLGQKGILQEHELSDYDDGDDNDDAAAEGGLRLFRN